MKKLIFLCIIAVLAPGLFTGAGAADNQPAARHGAYREERIGTLGDPQSKGLLFFPEWEMMYDFDQTEMPEGISVENSTAQIDGTYYATPCQDETNHSLKWTTQGAGSVIRFESGAVFQPTGYDWRHTWYFGVGMFQKALPEDASTRTFEIRLISDGTALRQYTIYLHREGWNFFSNQIGRAGMYDGPKPGTAVDTVDIRQTAGPGGEIYLDDLLIYICNARNFTCVPYIEEETLPKDKASDYPVHSLTEEEADAFGVIEARVVPALSKVDRVAEADMQSWREFYQSLHIHETENGFVNGESPLYYHRAAPGYTVLNDDSYFMNQRNSQFCKIYNAICKGYARTQDLEQKAELEVYVVNMAKLALTYGNMPSSWYGGGPFTEGAYYGREALEKAGLSAKLAEQIKAQYSTEALLYADHKWGKGPFWDSDQSYAGSWKATTDDLYNGASSTILSILVDADSPEKARDLYRLKSLLDNVLLNNSPGTDGSFKPDGTMFHHNIYKYDYGWQLGFDGATKYALWLANTPFALSEETMERLNLVQEVRYPFIDRDKRVGTPDQMIPGMNTDYALRLAQIGMPDGSMDINPYRASEWLGSWDGRYNKEWARRFQEMGIPEAPMPQINVTLPYGATNLHRRDNWKVQTYGSGRIMYHNEYTRPATLFYNLAGMPLMREGEVYAMQVKADDKLYGRDTFHPAPGYNFNRAPGVTAPDVDPAKLTQVGVGSEDFVGGLSTKNGNGVFTVTFDGKHNLRNSTRLLYQGTAAEDFRFQKSYFYFDDTIVALASNIGYGGGNEAVTTGIFQEKVTDADQVLIAGGEALGAEDFNVTYTSDEKPWFTDNLLKGGYYLFPGQSYTISRGEQTFLYQEATDDFDGKGRYVSAYINHPGTEIGSNEGSYAYIVLPNAAQDKMEDFEEAMKAETPRVQILRQDAKVHAVRDNQSHAVGYVFYDKDGIMEEGIVKGVSSPAVVMARELENGSGLALSIADPNLGMENDENGRLWYSQAKDISITLKGRWAVKEKAVYTAREVSPVNVTYPEDGMTVIQVTCKDGLSNEYLLERTDSPLTVQGAARLCFTEGVDYTAEDGVNMIPLKNLADMLGAGLAKRDDGGITRYDLYYRKSRITFTPGSQVAAKDQSVIILEQAAEAREGVCRVPLSVLSKLLKTEPVIEDHKVVYIRNDAAWKDWDEPPRSYEGVIFSGGCGGEKPEQGRNTLTLPETLHQGLFIFAVYKDGQLMEIQAGDLSQEGDRRQFTYQISNEDDPAAYSFKGMVFEGIHSMKPLLENEIHIH